MTSFLGMYLVDFLVQSRQMGMWLFCSLFLAYLCFYFFSFYNESIKASVSAETGLWILREGTFGRGGLRAFKSRGLGKGWGLLSPSAQSASAGFICLGGSRLLIHTNATL